MGVYIYEEQPLPSVTDATGSGYSNYGWTDQWICITAKIDCTLDRVTTAGVAETLNIAQWTWWGVYDADTLVQYSLGGGSAYTQNDYTLPTPYEMEANTNYVIWVTWGWPIGYSGTNPLPLNWTNVTTNYSISQYWNQSIARAITSVTTTPVWVRYKEKEMQNAYIGEVWTPWSNTIAYFPLKDDAVDIKNNISLTSNGTTNYTNVWWVKSAEFTKSNWLYNNNVSYVPQWDVAKTFSLWLYTKWSNQGWQGIATIWNIWAWNIFWLWNYNWTANIIMTRYWSTSNAYTTTLNTWTHIVVTYNNSTWKMYANWNLVVTWNTTAPTNWYNLYIWQNVGDTWALSTYYWNISNVILELWEWTAQEVANYYNTFKSNYWL